MNTTGCNNNSSSKLMTSLSALTNDKKWSLNSMQTSTTPSQGLRKFGTTSSSKSSSSSTKPSNGQSSSDKSSSSSSSSVDHHFILNG